MKRDRSPLSAGDGPTTIHVEVARVFFCSETFSAGRASDLDSGDSVSFAGALSARVGDRLYLTGTWERHPKFGPQFRVGTFRYDTKLDVVGLENFLRRSEAFVGIGASRARKIAAAIGDRFEEVLADEDRWHEFDAIGVPEDVVRTLATEWFARVEANAASVSLSKWGLTANQCAKLLKRFGTGVVRTIEEDPYHLIGRVRGFGFKTVDGIAVRAGIPADHPSRIREATVYALREQEDKGHTWTAREDLIADAARLLHLDAGDERAIVEATVEHLEAVGRIRSDPALPGWPVWSRDLHKAETFVAGRIQDAGTSPATDSPISVADAHAVEPRLYDRQAEAVVAAVRSRMSVVTGGAGTGKTFIVSTIAEILQDRGLSVALCAPTGKAAKRMRESIESATGMPRWASTIHKLLEPVRISGVSDDEADAAGLDDKEIGDESGLKFKFQRNKENPLEYDYVVVDEVSMMDVRLFRDLLRAVDPKRTSVLLVGDHNQLPPVGPGSVLRDLIAFRPCPVTVLDEVVRQAGELKHATYATLTGEVRKGAGPRTDENRLIAPWYVLGQLGDRARVREFVEDLFKRRLKEYEVEDGEGGYLPVDPWSQVQLLTPMHRGPVGTIELNRAIQRIRQAELDVEPDPPKDVTKRARPLPGDPVIWTKNDYKVGLMNGETGVVLRVDKDEDGSTATVVAWEGHEDPIAVPSDKQVMMQLAYALTVHKVQGSEYPIVVTVVDRSHRIMHHRGLLYTAVSRARRTSILVGDAGAIKNAARTVRSDERRSLARLEAAARELEAESMAER